jgi:hypothetical protein
MDIDFIRCNTIGVDWLSKVDIPDANGCIIPAYGFGRKDAIRVISATSTVLVDNTNWRIRGIYKWWSNYEYDQFDFRRDFDRKQF